MGYPRKQTEREIIILLREKKGRLPEAVRKRGFQWFKVQVSLRPIAEIALNLAQNLQMRQDGRGRKRQETERGRTKEERKKGKLVVNAQR